VYKVFDYCVEKRETVKTGSFCSFNVRGYRSSPSTPLRAVLTKDPVILLQRTLAMIEKGKQDDIFLGYADHWHGNYRKIREIIDAKVWTEAEHECHKLQTWMFMNPKAAGFGVRRLDFKQFTGSTPADYRYELPSGLIAQTIAWAAQQVTGNTATPEEIPRYTRRQGDTAYFLHE